METIKIKDKTYKCSKDLKEEIHYLLVKIEVLEKENKRIVDKSDDLIDEMKTKLDDLSKIINETLKPFI